MQQDQNPGGRCLCGCGAEVGPSSARPGHRLYSPGHQARKSPADWLVDDETGCWVWQRKMNWRGYGIAKAGDGREIQAHRWVWTRLYGSPGPRQLHHECENKGCVNPAHLRAVTPREHIRIHAELKAVA